MTTAVVILSVVVVVEYLIASGKISELVQDNAVLRAKNYELEHERELVISKASKLKSRTQEFKQLKQMNNRNMAIKSQVNNNQTSDIVE